MACVTEPPRCQDPGDALTEELHELATESLAKQVNILTASNIEYAAFLEKWKKQPEGSPCGRGLPDLR
ncbi:hypothetical protein HBI55_183180 [Parastagonospora nodorum]|nr:hypothetical protein HBI55_183180 [Parastagonospora nodorum]